MFRSLPSLDQLIGDVRQYGEPALLGAGAVAAVLIAWTIRRFLRTGRAHTRVGNLGVILATGFAAEGMWEVARNKLHLTVVLSVVLFAVFEVVAASQGLLAKYKLGKDPKADVSRHMNFVWATSAASGVIACTASSSIPEFLLRLAVPTLAAAIWWMDLTADRPASAKQQTSWIWTPRRIGIKLGLVRPGQQDLVAVDRNQRINALTVTAHRLHHGSSKLTGRRRAKLRRLALQADDAMVAEAQRRVARVHRIEQLTKPDAKPAAPVDQRTRDALDEVRLITREATNRMRSQHSLVFGQVDQPRTGWADQKWSNGVVQMPAALMDQIRTSGVDQPNAVTRTNGADQPSVSEGEVVQTFTSAEDRPARTTRRALPAARSGDGDAIPPRIQTMVRDLNKRYRGEIPGRRTVMDRMGWTSAGDAQQAINLLRAQRSKSDQN